MSSTVPSPTERIDLSGKERRLVERLSRRPDAQPGVADSVRSKVEAGVSRFTPAEVRWLHRTVRDHASDHASLFDLALSMAVLTRIHDAGEDDGTG